MKWGCNPYNTKLTGCVCIPTHTEDNHLKIHHNLCMTAAYRHVRELIQQEAKMDLEKKKKAEAGQSVEDTPDQNEGNEEKTINLRSLNMEDMNHAKNQVAPSFASEGSIVSELSQWNESYGEGGSRKKQQLSYFL